MQQSETHVKVPPSTLATLFSARGFDVATATERTGIAANRLRRVLTGDGELSEDEVLILADELAVPAQALFATSVPPIFTSVDFRSTTPRVNEFSKGTLKAISFVEELSSTLAALDVNVEPPANAQADPLELGDVAAIKLAKNWRKRWGLSNEEQLTFRDANKLYVSLRGFIEGLNVMVLHHSFGSDETAGIYARVDGGPHTIIINTTGSSKARKCFTLAHEFCHFLIRQEGVSNPSILKNKVEKFCNKFAAYLLAPTELIELALSGYQARPSVDGEFLRLFSRRLGISQEALVRRLVEMGRLSDEDYGRWRSRFNGHTPPGDRGDGGGGQSDPLQVKRTRYGTLLLNILSHARRRGDLDEIDIYRLCGLKPRFQAELFVM